jgi:hypothetical protein
VRREALQTQLTADDQAGRRYLIDGLDALGG